MYKIRPFTTKAYIRLLIKALQIDVGFLLDSNTTF